MASVVDPAGEPIPTSSVLMSAAKHIEIKCRSENVEFLRCKRNDPNPEKCLEKGRQATRCTLGVLNRSALQLPDEALISVLFNREDRGDVGGRRDFLS
ncbi:hypothetical protein CCACVL1_28377 [Corchorus capsularis]|uniref:Uncharacterized protein n=1 Tax=Corchorus capsularis TaxID=210143 RepID=A0A1R3G6P2_COCAP|nr:hypothetical protein CCACVL1_28377 [Corchorus capsularis]